MPDTQQFLESIWPASGVYCLMLQSLEGDRKTHRTYTSLVEAAQAVDRYKHTNDVYFAVHTLKGRRIWNPNKRGPLPSDAPDGAVSGGWSIRTQANAAQAQALYLDLDVGKADGYADQRDALAALKAFCGAIGLPRPTIVSSGYGVHVYWPLSRAADSALEWAAMAIALKALCWPLGLKADAAVTADPARILRPVGSINHKRGERAPVRLLAAGVVNDPDALLQTLRDACDRHGADVAAARPSGSSPAPASGSVGSIGPLEYDGPLEPLESVLAACAQIRRMADDPAAVSEPEWYAALGVVVHCAEGVEAAHAISRGHPGYDHAETQAKAERAAALPPTSCQKLRSTSDVHAGLCDGCRWWSKTKGPMTAARIAAPSAPPRLLVSGVDDVDVDPIEIPDPPAPYKRLRDGAIVMHAATKEGQDMLVPIMTGDLYPVRRMSEAGGPDQHLWRYHPRNGEKMREFTLRGADMASVQSLAAAAADNGVYVEDYKRLERYMSYYLRSLMDKHKAHEQHATLGWTEDYTSFVIGERVIHGDGSIKPALLGRDAAVVAKLLGQSGTLEAQVEAMRFYDDAAYRGRQFMILASMAAPWLYVTQQMGLVINAVGAGGTSKSTALRAAASVWGSPTNLVQNGLSHAHTQRGMELLSSSLSSLPVCVDEISLMGDEAARAFVMGASQRGGGGPKSNRGGHLRDIPASRKHTFFLTNSNRSLIDMTSMRDDDIAGAAAMRVLEIPYDLPQVHTKSAADAFIRTLTANYGHIGVALMRELTPRREKVERAIIARMEKIDATLGLTAAERFRSSAFATTLTVCDLSRGIGLTSWRSDDLLAWLHDVQLPLSRKIDRRVMSQSDPLSILTDFFAVNHGAMIVLAGGANNSMWVDLDPGARLLIHNDQVAKRIWVSRAAFRDYCDRRGVSCRAATMDLVQSGVIVDDDVRFTLGQGTKHAVARSRCMLIDATHHAIAAVATPVTPATQPAQTSNVVPLTRTAP